MSLPDPTLNGASDLEDARADGPDAAGSRSVLPVPHPHSSPRWCLGLKVRIQGALPDAD